MSVGEQGWDLYCVIDTQTRAGLRFVPINGAFYENWNEAKAVYNKTLQDRYGGSDIHGALIICSLVQELGP